MKGCTIIEPDGWQKAIEAPDGYFDAHFGSVVIEGDDEASIKQLFKLAPQQRLALLGVLGGDVPAWFKALETELTALLDGSKFELAWLAGKKTLVVHTDRVDDAILNAVKATAEASMPATATLVQYNHNMEISWRDVEYKYAECKKPADFYTTCPEKTLKVSGSLGTQYYTTDFTSDGQFPYKLPNFTQHGTNGWGGSLFRETKAEHFILDLPVLVDGGRILQNIAKVKSMEVNMPKCTYFEAAYCYAIERAKIHSSGITTFNYSFSYCTKLYEVDCDFSAATTMTGCFEKCILNKESALRVMNSIPSYTSGNHPLTIGIHIDHQHDDEVLAAIANAEAKGWTMTVQWNGTPTASASVTYGLRKPPIYARVEEHERPDGTTELVLDWGHYVTDPTGYEEFRSVEAAREYFGLPEEDLTNN